MNHLLSCLFAFLSLSGYAATYYVSATGSDGNNGLSASSPFKTIQKAANLTNPGDMVYVMNGTYTNSCSVCDGINITRSGTSTAWIKYTNYPGHTPKIKFNSWTGVKVFGAAYIEISGFEIEGNNANITLQYAQSQAGNVNNPTTSGNGIYIENNGNAFAHHVKMTNNIIHDCGGHGIGSHWADYITIENNRIYNNAWYSPLGCSGISLYQNKNFDAGTGYRIRIAGNFIYNNQMFIPFYYNGKIEDGNGMIIDDGRNTQNGSTYGKYNGAIRVENNVVFDNGGKGIHAYYSDNMDAVNNTCYQNCKSPQVKDGELSAYACSNVRFYNNATYSRSDARANHDGDGSSTNIVFNNNIYFNFSTAYKITKGTGDIVADPKFVAPSVTFATANLRLQSTSPGIDKGTSSLAPTTDLDNSKRPVGAGFDIGAYEFASTSPVNKAPTVSLTSPAANAAYTTGVTINIAANATDADGTVSKVEFFQGTTKLGEDLTAPYTWAWTNAAAGTYSLTAKATDNAGAATTSAAVSITVAGTTVNKAPTVAIASPTANASFPAGSTINIAANATDADGTVSKVEFFRGTTKLGEDLTAPYTWAWTNAAAGTYSLTAKATDNAGATTTSAAVSVTVTSGTTTNTCISKTIPPASSWVVRNSWTDQSNGSGISNDMESMVINHRQWGNSTLWVIESGNTYNLTAGKEYTITFDYKDDPTNKLASLEAGFAKSFDGSGATLLQPTALVPAGLSSTAYSTKSVKLTAATAGPAYLVFKLNWSGQPNMQVKNYLKNLSVCVPGTSFRISSAEVAGSASAVSLYPNPASDHAVLLVVTERSQPMHVQVFDAIGNKVQTLEGVTNQEETIGSHLHSGIYFIETSYGGKKELLKWIKQ